MQHCMYTTLPFFSSRTAKKTIKGVEGGEGGEGGGLKHIQKLVIK